MKQSAAHTKALRDEATRLLKEDRKRPPAGVKRPYMADPTYGAGGPSHSDSFVYVIGPKKGGPYKVGFARNVVKRLGALQIGSPVRLRTWGAWRCPADTAREVEKLVHKRADWARSHGEWFDIEYAALHQIVGEVRAKVLVSHGVLEVNGVWMEEKLSLLDRVLMTDEA